MALKNTRNSNQGSFNMTYYPKVSNDIAGAVLIELVDNSTKKLIWQSSIDANQIHEKKKRKRSTEKNSDPSFQHLFVPSR